MLITRTLNVVRNVRRVIFMEMLLICKLSVLYSEASKLVKLAIFFLSCILNTYTLTSFYL